MPITQKEQTFLDAIYKEALAAARSPRAFQESLQIYLSNKSIEPQRILELLKDVEIKQGDKYLDLKNQDITSKFDNIISNMISIVKTHEAKLKGTTTTPPKASETVTAQTATKAPAESKQKEMPNAVLGKEEQTKMIERIIKLFPNDAVAADYANANEVADGKDIIFLRFSERNHAYDAAVKFLQIKQNIHNVGGMSIYTCPIDVNEKMITILDAEQYKQLQGQINNFLNEQKKLDEAGLKQQESQVSAMDGALLETDNLAQQKQVYDENDALNSIDTTEGEMSEDEQENDELGELNEEVETLNESGDKAIEMKNEETSESKLQPVIPQLPYTPQYNFLQMDDNAKKEFKNALEKENFKIEEHTSDQKPPYISVISTTDKGKFQIYPDKINTEDNNVHTFIGMLEAHKNSALGKQKIMPKINTSDESLENWKIAAEKVYPGGGVILQTDTLKQPFVTSASTATVSEVVTATPEPAHAIRSPGF